MLSGFGNCWFGHDTTKIIHHFHVCFMHFSTESKVLNIKSDRVIVN
jgi:hypothetical protein